MQFQQTLAMSLVPSVSLFLEPGKALPTSLIRTRFQMVQLLCLRYEGRNFLTQGFMLHGRSKIDSLCQRCEKRFRMFNKSPSKVRSCSARRRFGPKGGTSSKVPSVQEHLQCMHQVWSGRPGDMASYEQSKDHLQLTLHCLKALETWLVHPLSSIPGTSGWTS